VTAVGLVVAQMRRRPLQTVLGVALLALGIATLVFVVVVQSQLTRQLERDARNIDLVVGAKGSPLQLVLSAVYQVDVPTGNVPLATVDLLRGNRLVRQAIPLAMGDSYRGFRIVGTEPAFWSCTRRRWRPDGCGAHRCRRSSARRSHSRPDLHPARNFSVPTASRKAGRCMRTRAIGWSACWRGPNRSSIGCPDRQGEFLACARGRCVDEAERRILEAEREVTAILVRYASPMGAAIVPRQINAESRLQAASPASEIARLFAVVGVGIETMRGFAWILVGSSLLALFVTLFNALEERRYDIAIMRLVVPAVRGWQGCCYSRRGCWRAWR